MHIPSDRVAGCVSQRQIRHLRDRIFRDILHYSAPPMCRRQPGCRQSHGVNGVPWLRFLPALQRQFCEDGIWDWPEVACEALHSALWVNQPRIALLLVSTQNRAVYLTPRHGPSDRWRNHGSMQRKPGAHAMVRHSWNYRLPTGSCRIKCYANKEVTARCWTSLRSSCSTTNRPC